MILYHLGLGGLKELYGMGETRFPNVGGRRYKTVDSRINDAVGYGLVFLSDDCEGKR